MGVDRDAKIILTYSMIRKRLEREGADKLHGRTILCVAEMFNVSPLYVQRLIKEKSRKASGKLH